MASNELSEQSQIRCRNFILKRIGKFWILKKDDTTKRLLFLDDAKCVAVEENILIADDKLYEINCDKTGSISFRKVEDMSDESIYLSDETDRELQHQCQVEEKVRKEENPWRQKEGQGEHVTTERKFVETQASKTCRNATNEFLSDFEISSDIYKGSDKLDCGVEHEHEKIDPDASKNAEIDNLVRMTKSVLPHLCEGYERFEVDVKESDLAKLCDIEGKMTLLVSHTREEIAFEDQETKTVKFIFLLKWIRRFHCIGSEEVTLEVGRKCTKGAGSISCRTVSASDLYMLLKNKTFQIAKSRQEVAKVPVS